jgi:hypothetical protein
MPVLHSCCAGSRPAMTLLVVAPPWTTASSINLRRATTVLPVAIGRPNSPPLRPLTKEPINAPRQHTASAEIPIASDAPPRHASRGFLPWRFAYAGPGVRRATLMGPPSANLHIRRHRDSYSITSSAAACSVGGTARPNALAVLRLMTNSNLFGCCTGRSAGFSPFSTRST